MRRCWKSARRSRALASYPKDSAEAQRVWTEERAADLARAAPVTPHVQPFPGPDKASSDIRRNNFLALVLCLMMGTAALPHVLVRYYTTPSVAEARSSVFWTLLFIMLIYTAMPALAVLVKYDIYSSLVGTDFTKLPAWVSYWASIDRLHPLVQITDINGDGIVQLAEIALDGDMVVLATPEIAGLPYVDLGAGRRRRPGRRAVDRRRPAADHLQRAVARRVLQDAGPEARRPRSG